MIFKRNYLNGIAWFILSLAVSNINDVIAKFLGESTPYQTIAFFRFLFGCLTLIPFMIWYGKSSFATERPLVHLARGTILFFAISIWIYGLNMVPIATATLSTFTIPLFVLVLARIFLKERVSLSLKVATVIGFAGVIVAYFPHIDGMNLTSLIILLSSFLFATLDIINKKFVSKETMLSMLFYSGLVTTILSIPPMILNFSMPSAHELSLLLVLGAGSNLILYFLLKAFRLIKASDVAPYRYLELIFSAFMGFFVFSEIPTIHFIGGAIIIIIVTSFVAMKQGAKES